MRDLSDQSTTVNISSNTLFHFTGTKNKLLSILQNGSFFPSFCPEYTVFEDDDSKAKEAQPPDFGIPMVSFCDLPLFLIKNHLNHYGPYGIGLKKEPWGMAKMVTPVFYVHEESSVVQGPIQDLFDEAIREGAGNKGRNHNLTLLSYFLKRYEGIEYRNNKCGDCRRFYNEREWRYVPAIKPEEGHHFLTIEEYSHEETRNRANRALAEKHKLVFTAADVLYIIVSDYSEVLPMIDELRKMGYKYDPKTEIPLLETCVVDTQRITED